MKVARWAQLILMCSSAALGQQASVPASATPPVTAPATAPDTSADPTPPQLLPITRALQPLNACKDRQSGTVQLSLAVDVHGLPDGVAVDHAQGTALEKMALLVVQEESFKPATLKGEPVQANWKLLVTLDGCYVSQTDAAGITGDVFRMTGVPVQTFAKPDPPKPAAPVIAAIRSEPGFPDLQRVGKDVSPPVPLNHVEAEFSEEARHKHIQGACLVTVVVDSQGTPQQPRVVRALGYGLDAKAIEAVRKYRFKPAMKAGVPVPVLITVQVNFRFTDY